MPIKFRNLGDTELEGYVTEILTESQQQRFFSGHDVDFSYVSGEGGRFRVNVFRKATGVGATFRNIPNEIPSLESLNLPDVLKSFCDLHQGMVLVTGSTGTGKSTTLAAMIDHLNRTRSLNIISLEDPIEFVHPSKRSQIIQRELGTHIPGMPLPAPLTDPPTAPTGFDFTRRDSLGVPVRDIPTILRETVDWLRTCRMNPI